MFGHDNHDDNDDAIQPSTTPVNEALLGVQDDDDDSSHSHTAQTPVDDEAFEEETIDTHEGPHEDSVEQHTQSDDAPQNTSNDLLDIKRQALHDLSPIVDQLDQTPEEKFKTTMMMIQATDDQSLIPHAYQAAQGIGNSKERAQALLDIVNEINYFTQPQKD